MIFTIHVRGINKSYTLATIGSKIIVMVSLRVKVRVRAKVKVRVRVR